MNTAPRLTVDACRTLLPGKVLKDHVVRGLQLHAGRTGKTWKLYHRVAGIQRKPALGYFPALTIELARDAARAMLAEVARGADPSRERQEARHAPTMARLALLYIDNRAKRNKPRTMQEIERHCRYVTECIGNVRVSDATPADVMTVLATVANRNGVGTATAAANRVRETMRGMFNFAETSALRWREPNSNPVNETQKHREFKRKALIQPHQFPAIARALDDVAKVWPERVAALWCIMFAGTRVTELISADRDEWRGDRIVLAEHKTDRTGDDRVIYLPRQARELLETLPRYQSGRLFGDIDRYNVFHAWDRARDIAGCHGLTVRDFRRTFASVAMSRGGASLAQIGELFSHKDTETTAGYAWLLDADASALTQRTADEIERMAVTEKK